MQKRWTDLPSVANTQMSDIINAVRGYVDPNNLGISTQQTISQVFNLFKDNMVLFNAGDPNGFVAGVTYQLCWDTVNLILWVCTTSGTSSTAVWTQSATTSFNTFVTVTGITQQMDIDTTYQSNNAALVTLTLPPMAAPGHMIRITGLGLGGWSIAQNTGQQIVIGNMASTIGVSGSVSSTNRYDGIELVCVQTNTTWQTINAPQGILNII